MQALPGGGAMAAVFADATQVEAALSECNAAVSIAAYNGPRNTVIAGASTDIEPLIEHFLAQGIECRRLTVSHAFHSPLMDPMLAAFRVLAEGVKYSSPRMRRKRR
jgi:acyl transferase domain-containing protein